MGAVKTEYFKAYFRYYTYCIYMMFLLLIGVFIGSKMFGDYWVGLWSKRSLPLNNYMYCLYFALINLFALAVVFIAAKIHSRGIFKASYGLNEDLLTGILRNKMEFFETTQIGVILNRFTKDVSMVDLNMSRIFVMFHFNSTLVIGIFVLMCIIVPFMIVLVAIAILILYRIARVTWSDGTRWVGATYDDVQRFDVIAARLIDGAPMAVRDKGPLFVIYPFDAQPELRNSVYYSRPAWQLRAIEVR